jgi:general secretion pathway protein A
MNLAHFHMRLRPFRASPDSQLYYPAAPHEAVLNQLQSAIDDDEGFVLLTGAPGTGKTLLAHLLLERLGGSVCSALITNCRFSARRDLLQTILFDLGLPYRDRTEHELRLALTEHILQNHAESKRTILIFDEAQDLLPDLLEELRLLSNLETSRGKAIQIVFVAQQSFLLVLRQPDLANLRQRLTSRLHLDALDFHEAGDFLLHQLRVAGAHVDSVISADAVALLARHTCGVPRLLNQAAAHSLSLAVAASSESIDVEAAMEALTALGIHVELEAESEEFIEPAETEEYGHELLAHRSIATAHAASVTSGYPIPGNFAAPSELAGAYVYQPGQPVRTIHGLES